CFTVPSLAGPKGTIHVRPLGDRKLTIDGDISDWPLAQFKKVAEQPVFPAGQNADSTTADGDHLVFDKTRIGLFNGTTTDDFQVTVAINSTFKPAGSSTNVLGARQSVERAGNLDLIGPDKAGPGGIYRDQLDAGPGPDIAARRYDDLRAAGALNPELAAKPNVKFTGYAIEMRVPLRGKIPDVVANHAMGFEIFWRDVDAAGDTGAGGSNISWASWAQSTDVPCTDPKTSLFNTANWGQLVFEETDPLVPIPADKPTILFVNADSFTTIHADIDLIEFFQDAGYA